jgi:hypothetical protein
MIEILEIIKLVAILILKVICFFVCIKGAVNYLYYEKDITNLEVVIIIVGALIWLSKH